MEGIPTRVPDGVGDCEGKGLIAPQDSGDQGRVLQAAKTKEEIIWEGARLLLFPAISPKTQSKREELTVVKTRERKDGRYKMCLQQLLCLAKEHSSGSKETKHLQGSAGSKEVTAKGI